MAKNKYPFKKIDLSPEQKLNASQRLLWRVIARMVKVVGDKYGEDGLQALSAGIRDWDYWNVSVRQAGVAAGQGTLRDLAVDLFGPGDDLCFTITDEPQITEAPDENRLLYKARSCNVADIIARECPDTCRIISRAVEEGVARVVNPDISVSGDRFLSGGEDACYIYVDYGNRAKKTPAKAAAKKAAPKAARRAVPKASAKAAPKAAAKAPQKAAPKAVSKKK
ncbi:MAG: hypothetical protein Q7T04_01095 [Dehalococcoidia bacterium]|nr:hypothetical protein [Dehalococcoidia bacterium]